MTIGDLVSVRDNIPARDFGSRHLEGRQPGTNTLVFNRNKNRHFDREIINLCVS